MQVKLTKPGLYGTENKEPGEILDVDESLARDIAARGDGELIVDPDAQVVPPAKFANDPPPLPTTPAAPAPAPTPLKGPAKKD